MIIDTHCHLNDPRYDADLDEVLKRAKDAGVTGFVIPGADVNDLPRIAQICEQNENIFFASGVHPYDKEGFDADYLFKFAKHEKCVAIGECGLDYFRLPEGEDEKKFEKAEQKRVFLAQLDMAVSLQKPVILHIRDANEDCYNILKEYASNLKSAVLHCFNASPLLLELAKIGNFYFGIGGVLTFNNAKNLVQILPKIPQDRLVIETDSPYLTPHPHRGVRNEPFYTTLVAKKMAEILNQTEEFIKDLSTQNAKRLFACF